MVKILALALVTLLSLATSSSAQIKRYDVLSYEGTIELDRQDTFIRGHVKMHAICTTGAPVDRVIQHLIYLDIDSVHIDGMRATIEWTGKDSGEYYVVPPSSQLIPGYFTVETWYHGKPLPEQNAGKWGGVSNRGGMMFAMGVGFQAPYISCTRHWLPCYDLPDDKADSARFIFVSKDPADVIAASGQLERTFDTLGGKAYDWNIIHPIASYLMTFAQGPFKLLEIDNPLNVQFEAYAQPLDTARTRRLMDRRVVRGLQFFDSLFSPYPFEKVGYVVAPIGSMEHQTMITLDRRTLDTSNTTAVHELAHMWWGDLVTCQTFADPWLNEGFATFSESLYLERFEGKQAYRKRQWEKIQSAKKNGSDYPMYGAPYHTNHTNNYPSAVIYDKGAAVLGMLRYHIGDALFFAGLQTYLDRFAYKNAASFDLWQHFESVTGQDMDWFFQKWVFEDSYPKLEISYLPGAINEIRVKQSSGSGYFRLPIMVEGTMKTGEKKRTVIMTDSAEVSRFNVEFTGFMTESLVFDPDSVLIADINVARSGVSGRKSTSLTLTPNPANHQLTIENAREWDRGSQVLIFDTSGILRYSSTLFSVGSHVIPLETFASGSYRVVIENEGQLILSEQVIVQH
jgi:aminopeptidase N